MPAKNPDPDWQYKTTADPETLTPIQEKKRRNQPQSIQPGVSYIPQVNTAIRFSIASTGVTGQTIIVTITDPNNTNSIFTATAICAGGETRAQVNGLISAAMIAAYESLLASSNFSTPTGANPSTMDLTYTPTWRTFVGGLPESPTVAITGTFTGCTATVTTLGAQAAMVKIDSQPINKNVNWEVVTTTPILGAWIYDAIFRGVGIEVNPDTRSVIVKKRRHNVPGNIVEKSEIITGAGRTCSGTVAGGMVTALTLAGSATALYGEYVSLTFSSSSSWTTRPSGYAYCSQANGVLDTTVITNPGAGILGTRQVETGTVVAAGGATSNGNLPVTVTGAGITGSPVTVNVALTTAANTATLVAALIAAALQANAPIATLYTVTSSGANVILTAINGAANDGTLNVAWTNVLGITALVTSTSTTAGIAPGVTVEINASTTIMVVRKDIDVYTATEAWTIETSSPFNGIDNALESTGDAPFPFPGRLDVILTQETGNADIGLTQPRSPRSQYTRYTYWLTSDEIPPTPAYDQILTQPQIGVSNGAPGTSAGIQLIGVYKNVLIDATSQYYTGANGIYLIAFPASTPSASEYDGYSYNLATFSCTNGTKAVTGTNSHFLSDGFAVGMAFGNTTIASINSDTSMTLTDNFTEPTITNQPFYERLPVPGWIDTVREMTAPEITPTENSKIWKVVRIKQIAR